MQRDLRTDFYEEPALASPRRYPDRAFSVFPSRENPFPRRGRSVPKADPAKFCQPFFYISVPAPTFPLSLYAVPSGRDRQKKEQDRRSDSPVPCIQKVFSTVFILTVPTP